MKIYTRHGDGGETGIWGGLRLAKDEARMEAIGTVDELTLGRDEDVSPEVCVYLNRLGDLLFVLSRYANHVAGTANVIWAPRAKAPEG